MSTAFAIAAVSACVRELLQNHLAAAGLGGLMGGNVKVSTRPPDRILGTGAEDPTQVNWFLHRVSPNAGWSNRQLPSRDHNGDRTDAPPLALNLHYVLSVFAAGELHAEILLGHGMQALHETPTLSREAIRRAVSPAVPPPDFPPQLALAGLAEQFETIKISLVPSLDEMSRLWPALNSHYRTSVFYEVTVVLIEATQAPRSPLPVARSLIYLETLDRPRLDAVADAAGPTLQVTPASTLRMTGRHLRGDDTRVFLGSLDVTTSATDISNDVILQPLSPTPTGLRAGLLPVRIVHRHLLGDPPVPHVGVESNVLGLVLHPVVNPGATTIQSTRIVAGVTLNTGIFGATVTPAVDARQRVFLLLNEKNSPPGRSPRGYRLAAPESNGIASPQTETTTLSFNFTDIASGSYLARLSVDGADSLLAADASGRFTTPEFVL